MSAQLRTALLRQTSPLVRGATRRAAPTFTPAASFHQAGARRVKESVENAQGRAEEVEQAKQDQLKKQEKGKGHWKGELASESEAAVKAERKETKNAADDTKELQRETEDIPKEKYNQ